jgi:hypothetical protein
MAVQVFMYNQVSGLSPAAGLKNGQFDRERNFLVLNEICEERI